MAQQKVFMSVWRSTSYIVSSGLYDERTMIMIDNNLFGLNNWLKFESNCYGSVKKLKMMIIFWWINSKDSFMTMLANTNYQISIKQKVHFSQIQSNLYILLTISRIYLG